MGSLFGQLVQARSEDVVWPELPKTGYISHRVASIRDIDLGDAVFVTKTEGFEGQFVDIAIPQYAYLLRDGSQEPVIVVQAEYGPGGVKVLGAKTLKGEAIVALFDEFEFLGTDTPK